MLRNRCRALLVARMQPVGCWCGIIVVVNDDEMPACRPPARQVSRMHRSSGALRWAWPIALIGIYVLLQLFGSSSWSMFPDSFQYARQAEVVLGLSPAEATASAADAYCRSRAQETGDQTSAQACVEAYRDPGHTVDARYESIFTSRPGYPIAAAPFVAVFGVSGGMRTLGLLLACTGGLLTYVALRSAGLRPVAAVAGQVVYLASPLGWWSLQATSEGLVNVAVLAALIGILAARRGRLLGGLALITVSWLALAFTRFSSLVLIGGAMAVACVIAAQTVDRDKLVARRGLLIVAALSAGAAAATTAAIAVLGLPGASVTLQDLLTRHFTSPPVKNQWWQLFVRNYHFWPSWLVTPSVSTALLLCAVAGTAALAAWRRDLMWIALGFAAAGFAQIAAHPLMSEAPRLGQLMWMPAVIGSGVLLHTVSYRVRRKNVVLSPVTRPLR